MASPDPALSLASAIPSSPAAADLPADGAQAEALRERKELRLLRFGVVLLLGAYEWCFGRFFPNAHGNLGHDYSYVLPDLLAGDYWFHQNGLFSVPWFTPAFCGGRPFFADAQSMYFSLAQWLSFLVDPLSAVHASLLVFAVLGFLGTYRLVRDLAGASREAAFVAGAVFMFNGFYAVRMIVGHYTFHSLMLVPLLAWLLTCGAGQEGARTPRRAGDAQMGIAAALVMAYMFNSGLGSLMVMAGIAVLALVCLVALFQGHGFPVRRTLGRVLTATAGSLALSASHLVASIALLGQFPRSDYLLPGFSDLWSAVDVLLQSLFIAPPDIAETAAAKLLNVQWVLGRHELEYGVGLVPFAALGMLGYAALRRRSERPAGYPDRRTAAWPWAALLAFLLAIPLAFNVYDRDWNALLKDLPLLGSSSTFVRWFFVYVPVLAFLVAPAIDAVPLAAHRRVALAAITVVLVLNLTHDFSAYDAEPYPARRISEAYAALAHSGQVPPVTALGEFRSRNGEPLAPIFRDDVLAQGVSQLLCYYPTFGYGLEHLPVRDMKVGKVGEVLEGTHFNLKNPACYVFPGANHCSPGDHFRVEQQEAAGRFVAYREWSFAVDASETFAQAVSVTALVTLPLGLLFPWFVRRPRA